jgi:Peptidyl-tRNA hydrolase PTH2
LELGYQAVQSIHAAIQFKFEHPEISLNWFEKSNYLGLLSVVNEVELIALIEQATEKGIPLSVFREPDIDNQITAIALAPGPQSKKLCSRLPLALKERK